MTLSMPPYFWQQNVWQKFLSCVNNGRLPHAILLTAPAGHGVDALAMAMGRYLLCLARFESNVCGNCKGCKLVVAGSHPDLFYIELEEKATQIKIDQVREVAEFINKTPQQGGFKIVIVTTAEKMNINAANALLKNLEEPAGETLIILVSENPQYLIPTIRSRCNKMMIAVPNHQQAIHWLKENNITGAEQVLLEAAGAPLTVLNWYQSNYFDDRKLFLAGLKEIADGVVSPITVAKRWLELDCGMLLFWMLSWIELLIKEYADETLPVNSELSQRIPSVKQLSYHNLFRFRDRLCAKKAQFVHSNNLNLTLFVEELTLDWQALVKSIKH